MGKKIAVSLFFLLSGTSAMAKEPWELDIPSLEEQIKQAKENEFYDNVEFLRNDPRGAGEKFIMHSPSGTEIVIDRRLERRTPGNPPPRMAVSDLLGNVSAETRGSMRIYVRENFDANGVLTSREWQIDFGGSWQVQSGFTETNDKMHK